jgi:dolichol-phosphate mannosyltransferase
VRPESVTVVVPTFNEKENLPGIVEAVRSHGVRLLVVDDNSPDGTGDLAEEFATRDDGVRVLHRHTKEGLGPAYAAGFERALAEGAAIVCEMDADFSHDPADLPRLVDAVESGAGVAVGSRYIPGGATPDWPWHRRLISGGGNWYARLALGLPVRDATGGFRAYSADCLRLLDAAGCGASGYAFQIELLMRATHRGCTIVEIPIVFRDRRYGTSKMGYRIVVEAMLLVTRWGAARWTKRLLSRS